MVLHIMQQADYRDAKAKKAENDFRVTNLSVQYREYPEILLFPVLLIVPSVRLLAGTGRDGRIPSVCGSGRDGSVLESVWTGRTAVDGMDGHLLPSCDR